MHDTYAEEPEKPAPPRPPSYAERVEMWRGLKNDVAKELERKLGAGVVLGIRYNQPQKIFTLEAQEGFSPDRLAEAGFTPETPFAHTNTQKLVLTADAGREVLRKANVHTPDELRDIIQQSEGFENAEVRWTDDGKLSILNISVDVQPPYLPHLIDGRFIRDQGTLSMQAIRQVSIRIPLAEMIKAFPPLDHYTKGLGM